MKRKIVHVCLANYYVDNHGFQENVLTKMHKLQGHFVRIIASTETFVSNTKLGYVEPCRYSNENGIEVVRLPYIKVLSNFITCKLRFYKGLYQELENIKPDIIFLHGSQFLSVRTIINYKKAYPYIDVIVDSHTDYVNAKWYNKSLKNKFSKLFLHKLIYKYCTKSIEKFSKVFYGTLPIRCDFLINEYGVSKDLVSLLPMGFDDFLVNDINRENVRIEFRREHNIEESQKIIISGGKFNGGKNVISLIAALQFLPENKFKLILFGEPDEKLKKEFDIAVNNKDIINCGWLSTKEIYQLLLSSDLGVFPGKHSVLWEQATGLGLPCLLKEWDNIRHMDLGGNCVFEEHCTPEVLAKRINEIFLNGQIDTMTEIAKKYGKEYFSYFNIAKKAIQ